MNSQWYKTIVVITGSYGGLGHEICKELDAKGAKLIVTGRDEDKLKNLKRKLPNVVDYVSGDITSSEFRNRLSELLKKYNYLRHVLINNAGISDTGFLENQSNSGIEQMLQVNLLAPILLTKTVLPWLKQAGAGKIVNIGSAFGGIGYPGFSGYSASKFGLRGFSQALNRELADSTVDVMYLAPRAIATGINSKAVNQLNSELKNNVDQPQLVAGKIISAIEKGRSEKFFGWPEKLFVKINGLFPGLVSGSIRKEHKKIKHILSDNTF